MVRQKRLPDGTMPETITIVGKRYRVVDSELVHWIIEQPQAKGGTFPIEGPQYRSIWVEENHETF